VRRIRVEVDVELIEQLFRTGNRVDSTCVIKGLPGDAKLKVCNGGVADQSIPLTFVSVTEGPDNELVDIELHTMKNV